MGTSDTDQQCIRDGINLRLVARRQHMTTRLEFGATTAKVPALPISLLIGDQAVGGVVSIDVLPVQEDSRERPGF